ncbi:mitochondrial intermembrane space import and assembly protein 40-like [Teratosphaeria destructans]|uniref:Mitochondrial intermembrane space import and assembly protein 40 n=1 Tax=Teratosphaeria destructans TaxID=418781 RepID=A0A9W7SWM6_9PEZI|nr:mitochondrial intermembrane space import and assembly protein 40-like [Teratosphaeria destructans]
MGVWFFASLGAIVARAMYRSALRTGASSALRATSKQTAARRFLSTAPPHEKSRSWKSSLARWGLAGGLVYYYNTSSVFAEEPAYAVHTPQEVVRESDPYPTVDEAVKQRVSQTDRQIKSDITEAAQAAASKVTGSAPQEPAEGSAEELEDEASQQGAFNEETGEINWDCPCLGGMAHGPCGEQFRAAFSCFVFSKEEPKGVECIEHFKTMQNCFREHPDVYGSELDEEAVDAELADQGAVAGQQGQEALASAPTPDLARESADTPVGAKSATPPAEKQRVESASAQVKRDHVETSESEQLVPKAWHDSR